MNRLYSGKKKEEIMPKNLPKDRPPVYFDVAVVGGGAAGMMAAGRAGELGAKVGLIEKNNVLGRKLLITGKGRCNFTHYEFDIEKFTEKFGRNGKFLYSVLSRFSVKNTINFFESRGVKIRVEQGNRIFPENGDAQCILNALSRYLFTGKVNVLYDAEVLDFECNDDEITGLILNNSQKIIAKSYIISTGGKSFPQTGSTGDGYRWAKKLGHSITEPVPSLNPIETSENWVQDLQGLSLKNVSLKLFQNGRKQDERFGEMLFTHFGVSGPIVMDMSKNIGALLKNGTVKLILDLKPALGFSKLDKRILGDFKKYSGRIFKNSLNELLPQSIIPVMVKLSGIEQDKQVDYITREERNRLVHLFKELELTPVKLLGFKWAVVTSGGVALKEVNPNTMASKKIKNLYFAGEILDLDGPSGGYNLQVCWSTGYLAGENAAKSIKVHSSESF